MTEDAFELLLVTGMSGAGRSTAARALEDLGWFVVDETNDVVVVSEALGAKLVASTVAAVKSILAEYRNLQAYAANL